MTIRNIWQEIPDIITVKLMEFLDSKKSGEVILHVKDGKIRGIDIRDCMRIES